MSARNLYIADPLWERIQEAAAASTEEEGRRVSASEWLSRAAKEKLERDGRRAARQARSS